MDSAITHLYILNKKGVVYSIFSSIYKEITKDEKKFCDSKSKEPMKSRRIDG